MAERIFFAHACENITAKIPVNQRDNGREEFLVEPSRHPFQTLKRCQPGTCRVERSLLSLCSLEVKVNAGANLALVQSK